ncbi:hypothetical protein TSOC_011475 [Tetrabaena socialis]|uniref:Uncharacterized protein n=1 Tax=Tetrabaena socialis TaxID=47790 RepID=A0A2J7ZQK2_9CHLO|nr:hypothetical protein TSOC_011475 [Tetrabaena socialis]|eukprot:PNH02536.1 hypothetical protein TSOC_011475 [Tetrabaena socialis]
MEALQQVLLLARQGRLAVEGAAGRKADPATRTPLDLMVAALALLAAFSMIVPPQQLRQPRRRQRQQQQALLGVRMSAASARACSSASGCPGPEAASPGGSASSAARVRQRRLPAGVASRRDAQWSTQAGQSQLRFTRWVVLWRTTLHSMGMFRDLMGLNRAGKAPKPGRAAARTPPPSRGRGQHTLLHSTWWCTAGSGGGWVGAMPSAAARLAMAAATEAPST